MGKNELGQFEEMALLAVLRLDDEAYGASIQQEIVDRTGRWRTISAIYVTLVRLQEKGLVDSELADPTPVRGGKAKRYFRVTAAGGEALAASRRAMQKLWEGIELPASGTD